MPISVRVADAHDHPRSAVAVALQVSGSGNPLTPSSGSTDATGTFATQLVSSGRYDSAVAVSSLEPATLYVGQLFGSLWKSTDRGASWAQVRAAEPSSSPEWPSVTAIAVDPTNASVIHAAVAGRGIVKSIDGGATWNDRSSGLWIPRATGSGVFKTTVAGE